MEQLKTENTTLDLLKPQMPVTTYGSKQNSIRSKVKQQKKPVKICSPAFYDLINFARDDARHDQPNAAVDNFETLEIRMIN